jgi:hypothetical protein
MCKDANVSEEYAASIFWFELLRQKVPPSVIPAYRSTQCHKPEEHNMNH